MLKILTKIESKILPKIFIIFVYNFKKITKIHSQRALQETVCLFPPNTSVVVFIGVYFYPSHVFCLCSTTQAQWCVAVEVAFPFPSSLSLPFFFHFSGCFDLFFQHFFHFLRIFLQNSLSKKWFR